MRASKLIRPGTKAFITTELISAAQSVAAGKSFTTCCNNKGRILPNRDSLLAATALEHDLTIIKRSTTDFAGTGLKKAT